MRSIRCPRHAQAWDEAALQKEKSLWDFLWELVLEQPLIYSTPKSSSKSKVRTRETRMEPRHPKRLEKNRNMASFLERDYI
jgi:hypothetical protein